LGNAVDHLVSVRRAALASGVMLTGPVNILNWSFVRDDQPRSVSCHRLAVVIRAEVLDLARAGVRVIQIDEAALREGLPLRRSQWQESLDWAVEFFRVTANGGGRRDPDPPTCATRNSTTSSRRSPTWTPMSSLDQAGLRPEDSPVERGPSGSDEHGRGGEDASRNRLNLPVARFGARIHHSWADRWA
jgi:hypothetical protein